MNAVGFLNSFDACVGHANDQKVPGFPDVMFYNNSYWGVIGGRTVTKGFKTPEEADRALVAGGWK